MSVVNADFGGAQTSSQYRDWLLADRERLTAWLDDFLTPQEAVEQYPQITTSVRTLENWRSRRAGPKYLNLPAGIRYRRLDLIAFMQSRLVDPKEVPDR